MSIGQKDIKLLWGRSGNRCAICKIELTQKALSSNASFTLGEQAHIVGEKEDAARGKSQLDQKERDSYHNLILLCPNDHTTIDRNESDWSIEKLHQIKSEHELWVTETLSETIDHVWRLTFHGIFERYTRRIFQPKDTEGVKVVKSKKKEARKMMNWWDKNFASCELGDERLSNRAYTIGKKLSEGYGKALSEIFKSGSELKRAYEFSPMSKQNLSRS